MEVDKGREPLQKRLGVIFGCLGAGAIVLSCVVGNFANLYFVLAVYGLGQYDASYVFGLGYFASGVVPFVLLLAVLQSLIVVPSIPRSTRKGWHIATGVGGVLYWLIFWLLWYVLLSFQFGFFREPFEAADGNTLGTIGALSMATLTGATIAFVSASPLGALQWLALRHIPSLRRWSLTAVLFSSLFIGLIVAVYCWATT